MVLVLCISSDDALYFFTKFHENVSRVAQSYSAYRISNIQIFKGGIFP